VSGFRAAKNIGAPMTGKRMWVAAWFVAVVGLCSGIAAANERFPAGTVKALDRAVDEQMREQNLPGVVVAIRVPGQGSYVVARRNANLRTGRPRQVDDPFRITSITKTFVATAVLQLVDASKLKKADKLA
jgi:CubicO group peptidase (beta-lactamase class C family)